MPEAMERALKADARSRGYSKERALYESGDEAAGGEGRGAMKNVPFRYCRLAGRKVVIFSCGGRQMIVPLRLLESYRAEDIEEFMRYMNRWPRVMP